MKNFLKNNWFKIIVIGILLGGVMVGGTWFIAGRNNNAELFANKERCATYTKKRQVEADEKRNLLGHSIAVQGFYSPIANTCMTNSQEIAVSRYLQRTLIDELTGKTEAFVFQTIGEELKKLSLEEMREQIKQNQFYGERLKYFQGE